MRESRIYSVGTWNPCYAYEKVLFGGRVHILWGKRKVKGMETVGEYVKWRQRIVARNTNSEPRLRQLSRWFKGWLVR